ncbi:MAG: acyl-CoA dehydrogenase family protein [Arenicella sp.]|nr:acyl-CoA dehydrogenase family protein [Arenicella sp.]
MLQFDPVQLPDSSHALRDEIRQFLAANMPSGHRPNSDFLSGHNPQFSELLGTHGYICMNIPVEYGGGGRSFFDRYVVAEELLAAGAPVSAHWFSDRQFAPVLMQIGTEQQRKKYLPDMCAGKSYFSIGMSEPNSGSDLAAIRTSATKVDGGWRVNGTKLWTTYAHLNHYMIALVRTAPVSENRHHGMSQLLIDLHDDSVDIRPIKNMGGDEDFNEVVFNDTYVPDEDVIGEIGNGWNQCTAELGYERSGSERFLSTFRVYIEFLKLFTDPPNDLQAAAIGRIASNIMALRRMSLSVVGMLEAGKMPSIEAALVKELGNNFEKIMPEIARLAAPLDADKTEFNRTYRESILLSPSTTLRGGTREILRGVIARGLGLR